MAKSKRSKRKAKNIVLKTPQKGIIKKPPAEPISTHKVRSAWFNAREAWPQREAPVELVLQARAEAASCIQPAPVSVNWVQAGPTNIGGRMTSIVVHPNDSQTLWVGSAGGGVWTSTDGGLQWRSLWHSEPTLNIGSLAIDSSDPNVLYCGTGEANQSADSHAGVGVYRSMDAGVSWQLIAPAHSHHIPRRIGRIAIDPFNSNHLLLAGLSHRPGEPTGLYQTFDGGMSWARVTAITSARNRCHEVIFHPTIPAIIYCTIDALGRKNGVWKSEDGGSTWHHLESGFGDTTFLRRISLAISTSNPSTIYAQAADKFGGLLGIFRTRNGGTTWTNVSGNHFNDERQMTYNNTISVDPVDENTVICGGVDLHRTTNGGQTWKKVSIWHANRGASNYAHADQHAICHALAEPEVVYAMNDGGMDVSLDGGKNWENRSAGLATNMFYDLSVSASNLSMHGGGLQDNGTVLTLDGNPDTYFMATGGDGGFCAIDPSDTNHLFTSSQRMRINRFRGSDGWKANIGPNEDSDKRPWMAFIAMDPANSKRVFVGSKRVWRSTNDGSPASWRDVSGILDNSFITCIEISRADSDVIYVGTENGGIFRSLNGGTSWSDNLASSTLPGRTITRLRTPANDANILYAAVSNFGNSHLYRSMDAGNSWQDIDQGNLPDVPHHGIVIPKSNPDTVLVANDAGVFVSNDTGLSWKNLSGNLPTVMVVDLVLHEASKTLFAATYGRSTWKVKFPTF